MLTTQASTTIDIQLPPLLPLQREVSRSTARFRVVCCGRRWGKTRMAVLLSLYEMLQHAGAVMWIAPSFDKTNIGWRIICALVKQMPFLLPRFSEKRIDAPNGGWIQFRSADSRGGLRGEGLTMVIVDECAHIRGLEDIWTQELRPSLSDRKGGAVFISTPYGYNYFHTLYAMGLNGGEWQSWKYPTATNPRIDPAEIETARMELPEIIFRQEYLAEFITSEGAVFRRVHDAAVLDPIDRPLPGHQYIAGVDLASNVDYTVISVMDVTERSLVYLDRFHRLDYTDLAVRLKAAHDRFGLAAMKIEVNSIGQPVIDILRSAGISNIIPFTTTSATKQMIIQRLQAAFERAEIRVLKHNILLAELLSFESRRNASGSFSYFAPPGMHDDCVMSLAIAWDCLDNGSIVIEENPFYS